MALAAQLTQEQKSQMSAAQNRIAVGAADAATGVFLDRARVEAQHALNNPQQPQAAPAIAPGVGF